MFKLLNPILSLLPPETAHKTVMFCLKMARHIPGARAAARIFHKPDSKGLARELFGVNFPNPVGLAAGFDTNGEYYNELADYGFGFIEIGSLTPKPQMGNETPRLFRLPKDNALVSRMGTANNGVRYAIEQIKQRHPKVVIGANVTRNTSTPTAEAYKDYERSVAMLYDFVDFFVLNVSYPDSHDSTGLHDIVTISQIVDSVMDIRRYNDESLPILLKISHGLSHSQLDEIIDLSLMSGIDGIVAGNAAKDRGSLRNTSEKSVEKIGEGVMSGAPLFESTLDTVRYIHQKSGGILPVIASGGIMTPEQAAQMLDAGASLIEVYTGFVYNGPDFVRKIVKHLKKRGDK